MKKTNLSLLFICLIFCMVPCAGYADSAEPLQPFPDHARYAAIGDSITHGGWYHAYVELYYLTCFPTRRIDVFNCGIHGNKAVDGVDRYAWDIAPVHPTVASILFGMNDVGILEYAADRQGPDVEKRRADRIDDYEKNLRILVDLLQKDHAQVIILLPTIYDDFPQNKSSHYPGLNEAIGQCARRAQKVADEKGCAVVDFYHPMLTVTQEQKAADPGFSMVNADRVHPNLIGHLFMAYLFLKAQHVPADVAKVAIRATDGSVELAENCRIDQVETQNGRLTFRYSANAIPLLFSKHIATVDALVPFTRDLNQEIFKITSLPPGTYQLSIDRQPIRTYTADELAAGVNLAVESDTPQMRQAQQVWSAYQKRVALVMKLRTIIAMERLLFAPQAPQPGTLEQMEPRLQAYADSVKKTRSPEYRLKQIAQYREDKAHESEMRNDVDAMLVSIRELAQPKPHVVSLVSSSVPQTK